VPRVCNLPSERSVSTAWVSSVSETSNAPTQAAACPKLIRGCRAAIEGLHARDDLQYVIGALQGSSVGQQDGAAADYVTLPAVHLAARSQSVS
jgi:hypothetical protein